MIIAYMWLILFAKLSKIFLLIFLTTISAIEVGLKETVPSYLDPNIQNKDLITGVSFASGGTGYDPQTSELVVQTYLNPNMCLHI